MSSQIFEHIRNYKKNFFFLETTVTCVNTIFTIKVPVIFPDSFKSNLVTANTVPELKCRELELRRNKTEFNYSSCFSKYFKLTNEESSIFRTKLVANEEVKRKITISDNCYRNHKQNNINFNILVNPKPNQQHKFHRSLSFS